MYRLLLWIFGILFLSQVLSSCKKLDEFVTEEEANLAVQKIMIQCADTAFANYSSPAMASDSSLRYRLPLDAYNWAVMRSSYPYLALSAEDIEERINTSIHNVLLSKQADMHNDLQNIPISGAVQMIYGGDAAVSGFIEQKYALRMDSLITPAVEHDFLTSGLAHEYAEFADEYNDRRIGKRLDHNLDEYCFPEIQKSLLRIMRNEEYNIRHIASHQGDPLLKRIFK